MYIHAYTNLYYINMTFYETHLVVFFQKDYSRILYILRLRHGNCTSHSQQHLKKTWSTHTLWPTLIYLAEFKYKLVKWFSSLISGEHSWSADTFLLLTSIHGTRSNCPIFLKLDHSLWIQPHNFFLLHLQLRMFHYFYPHLFCLTFKLLLDSQNNWFMKYNCKLHKQMMHWQISDTAYALSLASGSLKRLILVALFIQPL